MRKLFLAVQWINLTITGSNAVINMWIHEHKNWPNFTWDTEAIASKLADIRYFQGCLLGHMERLGFGLKREASLSILTNDLVKSSAFEGKPLNPEDVRSSVARRLGLNVAMDGLLELLVIWRLHVLMVYLIFFIVCHLKLRPSRNSIMISLNRNNVLRLISQIGCHGF